MAVAKRTWTTKSGETRMAWVVHYYDAEKKYRQKTFKRERDAKAWEAQIKVDLKRGIHRPDSTSATISEAGALWLERGRREELETWTIRMYKSHFRLHIEPATVPKDVPNGWNGKLGDVKLSQLTSPRCEAFRDQLLKTNSRKMARKILTSFRAILVDSQRRGLIAYNPAQPVRIDTKTREEAPIRIGEQIPSKADIRAILAASTDPWHPLFLTAAFTGMRASELRGLIWPNVDLDGCVIHVCQRADEQGKIGPCKSKAGYRDIQISDAVADELRRWKLICPPGPLNLVFPNGRGNVQSHGNVASHGWYRVQHRIKMVRPSKKAKSGLKAKYGFHSVRHFYASIMIDQGTPPKRLQSLMGHATLAETMDTYGHLFPAGEDETTRINNAVASVLTASPEEPSLRDIGNSLLSATNRIETVDPSDAERCRDGSAAAVQPPSQAVPPTDTAAASRVGDSASRRKGAALESEASEDGPIEHLDLTDAEWALVEPLPSSRGGRDVERATMTKPAFYECEVCGFFHPDGWDCAAETRFIPEDLDERYGDGGWVEIDPPVTAPEPEPANSLVSHYE
jgi:integrase